MPDAVERKIARMVVQDGLSPGEANAAMHLISILAYAGVSGERSANAAQAYPDGVCDRGRTVNRREQQAIHRIADDQMLRRWWAVMAARGDDPSPTVAILSFGESFSAVDRRNKRRKGWARRQVRLAIGTFYEVLRQGAQEAKLDKSGQKEYQIG